MKALIALILIFVSLLITGCTPRIEDNRMFVYSPSRDANIVDYFKKGTTNAQINEFINHTLGTPHPGGGFSSLPGVQGDLYVITQGYEGYAITLRDSATEEQRQNILAVIRESPLIFKVFENAVPDEIILDSAIAEKERRERERAANDNRPTKKVVVARNSNQP